MNDKTKFLEDYCLEINANVYIFQPCEIKKIPLGIIPQCWYDILSREDVDKRVQGILETWKKYLSSELYNTINYLEENLLDIELFKINDKYYLLYSIKTEAGEIQYYEGGNPLDSIAETELESVWNKIPESIRIFYENIHNGFYDYASKAMGIICTKHITNFGEVEWGIIYELEESMQIDLKSTFGFFNNGMGGYLAIDIINCDINSATLWFSDDQPEYNLNFWDVVDEWTKIGLQDI